MEVSQRGPGPSGGLRQSAQKRDIYSELGVYVVGYRVTVYGASADLLPSLHLPHPPKKLLDLRESHDPTRQGQGGHVPTGAHPCLCY